MAKHITVRAAQSSARNREVESVYLTITGCFPYATGKADLYAVTEGFKEDAERVFLALRSLPGGTFDQLLILMLKKTASSFIVPHDFHDEEKPKSSMLALLEKALPIIENEAGLREFSMSQHGEDKCVTPYWSEMRDLANEISAEIDKAHGRSAPDPELCPHGFGFVEYCPDCEKGKEASHG